MYGRSGAADACPDESALRRAVASRIGYDPFFPTAPRTVIVTIAQKADRLVARVQLVDDGGRAQGARELDSAETDCEGLFDTVALTISIAIDPQALVRPSVRPPPPEPVSEPPRPPPPASVAPATYAPAPSTARRPEPARESPELRVVVSLRGSFGLNPGFALGGSFYAGASWTRASLGLEAQADLPASASVAGGGSVTAWLVAGALVPCLRFQSISVCAIGVLGRLDATASGVASPRERAAPYLGFGARVGIDIHLSTFVSLRAQADAVANAYETTLTVGTATPWTAPPVAGVVALGALATF